jgi:alpha-beta hydrolase superfamily lysophospholipase
MNKGPLFTLEETQTADQIRLRGIIAWPQKPAYRALIFVHGLSSNFYHQVEIVKELAIRATELGWAAASFHNRGCEAVSSHRRYDGTLPKGYSHHQAGQAHEIFTNCVHDLRAVVDFLKKEGIREVILIGHSTGCQKSVYYMGTRPDKTVVGIVLLAPLNDRLGYQRDLAKKLPRLVEKARSLVKAGKEHQLMGDKDIWYTDAQRFLSLAEKGSSEDIFPYDNPKDPFTTFSSVGVPMLIILGDKDEYLDRPAEEVLRVLRDKAKVPVGTSVVRGAFHNFTGFEKQVVADIVGWVQEKFDKQR